MGGARGSGVKPLARGFDQPFMGLRSLAVDCAEEKLHGGHFR
jgi:hypothetical protein